MATTFINYEKDKGFEINEAFMEILSNFICQVFESRGLDIKPQWYIELYEDFDLCTKGTYQNWMAFNFEDYLENDTAKEKELISILEETKSLIAKNGEEVSIITLQKFEEKKDMEENRNKWTIPIKTKDLINLTEILIKMFKYEWKENDYSVIFEGFSSSSLRSP